MPKSAKDSTARARTYASSEKEAAEERQERPELCFHADAREIYSGLQIQKQPARAALRLRLRAAYGVWRVS